MSAKTKLPRKPRTTESAPQVFFTRPAFRQHFFHGAKATLRGEEYRCEPPPPQEPGAPLHSYQ
jgi:hypothetical protein